MAERKFGDLEIKIDRPLASTALHLQARLTRAAGGNIQGLFTIGAKAISAWGATKGAPEKGASVEEKAAAQAVMAEVGGEFISAIALIFERLTPDEYVSLVGDIVGLAQMRRPSGTYSQLDLDGDLSLNMSLILPIAAFILKEVYADFFSGGLGNGNRGVAGKR